MCDHKIKILCKIIILVAGLVLVSTEKSETRRFETKIKTRGFETKTETKTKQTGLETKTSLETSNTALWPWTFLVPFLDPPICAVINERAL